ncbi:LLM class flavin-dependent oxidoreductase [Kitasatospora aureofaciens]|uniref:LLM class flavin-dependent oxidoreductase n=1 Tax=Kitasatospora aureofaciens TaxID=1894 RepID=UPI001F36A87B|nr:LLM class flavin-dependent oxidoreductase [Kitasatospora aureofaciens]
MNSQCRDETWFGAVPTLTAAATATERIRLGTLVTSPDFRHPGTLAQELTTLDDISGGRLTVGIGAGGTGFDTQVLGGGEWTPRQRADRFTAPPQRAGAAPKRQGLRPARRARPTAAHTRRARRE